MGQLVFQATLGGQVNLVGPNTASTYNINVPAVAGNMVTTGDTGTVTNTMCASSVYTAPGTIGSGTPNSGAFTTLSASSTVSGTGFSTYLASPPAIGGTAAAAITGTNIIATSGLYAKSTFGGSYLDGIVADYTTGLGRISVGSSDGLAFYNGGVATTELMRLDSSGNLGIGTSSPALKFQVNATSGYNGIAVNNSSSTTATRIVMNNDTSQYLQLDVGSSGRSSYGAAGPNVVSVTTGATGGFNLGTDNAYPLAFYTNSNERMRIDSSGNLLVGTTSGTYRFETAGAADSVRITSSGTGTSGTPLYIRRAGSTSGAYFVAFDAASSGAVGSITYNGSGTAYNTSSDYRLKENVQPMTGALTKIAALKPCTYTWKLDGSAGEGFIAHELAEVCPHAVVGEKDAVDENGNPEYQGIDTSFLVATLTAAIQEQQAIITQQAASITQLQTDVAALKPQAAQ